MTGIFSLLKKTSVIEFGATEIDGNPVYFVRDNGPGFAMADAEQLFVTFQRLFGTIEFSGFGIGQATVERIICRHGAGSGPKGNRGKGRFFTSPWPTDWRLKTHCSPSLKEKNRENTASGNWDEKPGNAPLPLLDTVLFPVGPLLLSYYRFLGFKRCCLLGWSYFLNRYSFLSLQISCSHFSALCQLLP